MEKKYKKVTLHSKVSREKRKSTGAYKYRSKKRKPPKNQYEIEEENNELCTSAKKLRASHVLEPSINNNIDYVILNFATVFSFISEHVKWKTCGNDISFAKTSTRGLGFKVQILCPSCVTQSEPSCPYISNAYEINTKFIFAMRMIGIGLNGAKNFVVSWTLQSP